MNLHRHSLLAALLVSMGLAASANAEAATTYYVRTDGGDANQCNGRSDAAYPGSGSAQNCAWKHPFFALPPGGTPRIAGGDTLLIGGGSYEMGQGAPGSGSCGGASCYMAPIPSGPSATSRTRILGKPGTTPVLWGSGNASRVLNLDTRSNIEIGNLEITDRSDCVYSHSQSVAKCVLGTDYARTGLYARNSKNVWLHDLNIHGLAHMGMNTGALSNWLIERVRINKNGRAGWDGSVGGTASSNSGSMVLRNVEVAWNGCGERWQTGEVWACWAQQTGGYGDGIGTYYTGGQWLIEDSFIHHNTSDGLDLRYMDGAESTTVTIRRLHAVGNAGNQAKVRGNAVIENSVLIGNCAYWKGKYYMVSGDECRANGNTLQFVPTSSDVIVARHNTITGEGGVLIGANEGDSTSTIRIENNVLVGQPYFKNTGVQSSIYYANNAPAKVTWAGNLVWKVKNNTCPTGSICNTDPKLANLAVDNFNATPQSGSPVIDKVGVLAEISTDFLAQPRPYGVRSDIGAYEVQPAGAAPPVSPTPDPAPSPTCTRAAPTLTVAGPSTAVVAGTSLSYAITLRNNDSAACANTNFALARTVPTGWTGTLSTTGATLAPGASTTATLAVTSAGTAAAGSYGIGIGTSSAIGAAHTAKASATYSVGANQPALVPGFATTTSTSKLAYAAGETVTMTARVLNDGRPVAGASVKFDALKPNRTNHVILKATTDSQGIARVSFKSGTGPSSIGTYALTTTATSGNLSDAAMHSFSVGTTAPAPEPAPTGFETTTSTSKTSYAAGETVTMTARVLNDGNPVAGASVKFDALKPNLVNHVVLKATTDSQGIARVSFTSGTGSSSIGTYALTTTATSGSLSDAATHSFSVGTATSAPEPAPTGFTGSVSTSRTSYSAGSTVYMTSRVLKDGRPVVGARVQFTALKPNRVNKIITTGYTDAEGYARRSFVSGTGPSSIGTYQLSIEATSGSLTARDATTFSVYR